MPPGKTDSRRQARFSVQIWRRARGKLFPSGVIRRRSDHSSPGSLYNIAVKTALCYKHSMVKNTLLISVSLLATSLAAFGEQRMIRVGDRRLSVYCDGEAARSPTVVLIPAGGRTAKDWRWSSLPCRPSRECAVT